MADFNLPGHVKCTRAQYDSEMSRIKASIGGDLPTNWESVLTGDQLKDAKRYVNNIYFCEDTGEIFHREVCYGASASITDRVKAIENEVFKLVVTVSGNTINKTFGETASGNVTWTVKRDGKVVTPTKVTVDGVQQSNLNSYAISGVTTATTKHVIIYYNEQQYAFDIKVNFYHKKFYGTMTTSNANNLTAADVSGMTGSLATNATFSNIVFNCTGGKYPYIIIPTSVLAGKTPVLTINGLTNTDWTATTKDLTISPDSSINYTIIVLNNIQYSSEVKISVS